MQELTHKAEQQAAPTEEGYQGISMAPPAFQLLASPYQRMEGEVEEGGAMENPTVKVANFALILEDIENSIQSESSFALPYIFEKLKHDQQQIDHFRTYFLEKKGETIEEYITRYFDPETSETVTTLLSVSKGDKISGNVEDNLILAVREQNIERIYIAMSMLTDADAAQKKYQSQYPGSNLYSDICALSSDDFNLLSPANKVFGKWNNFESVEVQNEAEAKEARLIIARIYEQYDIVLDSQSALDDLRRKYADGPRELLNSLQVKAWTLPELQDLEYVLRKYENILGDKRMSSDRQHAGQEVRRVGRLNNSVEEIDGKVQKANHAGVYDGSYTVRLFDTMNSEALEQEYDSNETKSSSGPRGVMAHELAHGLLNYLEEDFIKATGGYWLDRETRNEEKKLEKTINGARYVTYKSMQPGAEAPPTQYGRSKNAGEDLADSAALFLLNPVLLLNGSSEWNSYPAELKLRGVPGNPCPKRFAFFNSVLDKYVLEGKKVSRK